MKKLIPVILISVLFLSGCGKDKKPVRIGVNSWPPCEIWYVAEKMGFFGSVPVEIVRFSVWSDNMKSLYMGNTDITHSTYFNALHYVDKGERAKVILSSDTIIGGDGLVVKDTIKSVAELRNRKIAVEINTDEHFLLYKTLKLNGLDISDTTLINSSASEGKEIFVSGKADAIYTYEPYLSEAASKGGGRRISSTKDIPGYMIDTIIASEKLLSERPEDVKQIISAWFKAQDYINKNPEESFRLMASKEGMTHKDFEAFYRSFKFYSAEENKRLNASEEFSAVIAEISQFLGLPAGKYKEIFTTNYIQ